MASILQVKGKWRAQVRMKGHKPECKTFPTKRQAELWAAQREADLSRGVAFVPAASDLTVGKLLDAYRELRDQTRPISDSSNEHYMLKALKRGLGDKRVAMLTPQDLVDYATMRREEGAGPYTINMDISKLGTAMRYASVALKVTVPDAVGAARPLLNHLRLIGGGGLRERRPTEDELRRVLRHLQARHDQVYAEAVAFAAITAMRRGEICALGFEDIDQETHIATVWSKHPRKGKTLEKVPLLGEAWEIVQRRPRGEPQKMVAMTDRGQVFVAKTRVFPVHPQTLSKYFKEACTDLGIPDLRLHDMRHEGTSRLFEEGYEIQQVALVTRHKDWRNLKRYTNLKPESMTAKPAAKKARAKRAAKA